MNPRGAFIDRLTQRWVRWTGRAVVRAEAPWLDAPVGDVDRIGTDFFRRVAERDGLTVVDSGAPRGLLRDVALLEGPTCRVAEVDPGIRDFYERTSAYEFDVWSEWCGAFRPFGALLGRLFARRLGQLDLPTRPLDTRLGMTSEVLELRRADGAPALTAWVREVRATGRTLYAGSYATCTPPGAEGPCVKVAFPLPNGFALVVLRPESYSDGSLTVRSAGRRFGDPGFYLYVEESPGRGRARYVRSMKEHIHVHRAADELRADHELRFFGIVFLRLHYRLRGPRPGAAGA